MTTRSTGTSGSASGFARSVASGLIGQPARACGAFGDLIDGSLLATAIDLHGTRTGELEVGDQLHIGEKELRRVKREYYHNI